MLFLFQDKSEDDRKRHKSQNEEVILNITVGYIHNNVNKI